MPQHPVTKKLDSYIPIPGHNVLVILVEEMIFDEMIIIIVIIKCNSLLNALI